MNEVELPIENEILQPSEFILEGEEKEINLENKYIL